jgi:ABC-type molybdenum transport system ATPase subunit/photorepair protein PhrA
MQRPSLSVHLRQAQVRLGGRAILRSIDLDLTAHAFIHGDNGAGKTTLLRLLAAEIWPQDLPGRPPARLYSINGQHSASPLAARPWIRLVAPHQAAWFQEHHPRLPVHDLLAAGAMGTPLLYGPVPEHVHADVGTVAEKLALAPLLSRPIHTLSSGEMQRALLGRAILGRPSLLLVDEWQLALDPPGMRLVRRILEDEAAQGAWVVLTSHAEDTLPDIPMQHFTIRCGELRPIPTTRFRPQRGHLAARPTPQPGPVRVAMRQVAVTAGESTLLEPLSWQGNAGETWVVAGKNGAGKSTFLQLVSGWRHPAPGGEVLRLEPALSVLLAKERMGVLAPWLTGAMEPATTVLEAILSGFSGSLGRPRPLPPGAHAAARTLAQDFGIEAWLPLPVGSLSLGQMRLVHLARAVVHQPLVLVLDEPFAGLDAPWQHRLAALLASLATDERLVVVATHHPHHVAAIATHAMVLDGGRVSAMGPWVEVTKGPSWRHLMGEST